MAAAYEIQNLLNGKVYIGSTIQEPLERKGQHWCLLRSGTHHNPHLQNAWNKYGEDAFKFVPVLELDCSEEEIRDIETQLIRKARLELGFENVYTILEGGTTPFARAGFAVEQSQNPEWREAQREGSRRKAEDKEFTARRIEASIAARSVEVAGFVSPTGEVFAPVRNIRGFCAEYGLSQPCMWMVANGKRKSHKDWTLYQPE